MKKTALIILAIFLLSISLMGCTEEGQPEEKTGNNGGQEQEIIQLVEDFGGQLQKVSLLAPQEILEESMQENYGEYVAQELISQWLEDPTNAPGRLTSSPWPDRIEIDNIEEISEDTYQVEGEIIEVTSAEKEGEVAARRGIILEVKQVENKWLIVQVTLGEYEESELEKNDGLVYENKEYGFSFALPESWEGYKVITEEWEGTPAGSEEVIASGPKILIRHPQWTAENPRQDIPIMVMTLEQWNSLQAEEFHIGAAPIGPKELGRNDKYVFALPARYNYAFPTGYEEVEEILNNNPLQPLQPAENK